MSLNLSPSDITAAISIAISWGGSLFISGRRTGITDTRLTLLERQLDTLVTKAELAVVATDVAEIKGMFKMTLKDNP